MSYLENQSAKNFPYNSHSPSTICVFSFLLLLAATIPDAYADWIPYTRATIEQIYDSNIFLEPAGENRHDSRSDFRTNISPTIGIRNETQFKVLSLEYSPYYSYFVKNSNESYLGHTVTFDFNQSFSARLSIYANDSFNYSEEPLSEEYGEEISTTVNYGRRKNIRNTGEGGVVYQFGMEDFFRVYYLDSRLIYPDNSGYDYNGNRIQASDDSVEYGPGAEVNYWINQRNGIDLLYEWQRVDYQIRYSRVIDHLDAGYTYRWSPHTSLRVDYIQDNVRTYGDLSPDYKIYQATAGFERIFSPSLDISLMAGFFHRSMEDWVLEDETQMETDSSQKNNGFMGHVDVHYTRSNWNVSLTGEAGVRLEFSDYNNRGYTPYREISIDGRYDFSDRLHGTLNLSYTHETSPDTLMALVVGDHRIETYNVTTGLEYLLLEWLTCGIEYQYNDQSETQVSDLHLTGYNDNVFTLRLTATYDWRQREATPETNSWQPTR